MPEKWLSHGGRTANMTYLRSVETLLRAHGVGTNASADDGPAFVRHRDLAIKPGAYVKCICRSLAAWSRNCEPNLVESPQIRSPQDNPVHRTASYLNELRRYTLEWEQTLSRHFPSFASALERSDGCS